MRTRPFHEMTEAHLEQGGGGHDSLGSLRGNCSNMWHVLYNAFETDLAYYSCSSACLPKLYLNNKNKLAHGFDVTETDDICQVSKQGETMLLSLNLCDYKRNVV